MQIGRLFEIVYLLLDRRSTTAQHLADHFEVSKRTILRDIDVLCAAGIPIYTSRGKHGGISIMEGFVLNRALVSREEQDKILFALKSLAPIAHIEADATLDKLKALWGPARTDWIDIDFSAWGSEASERERFSLVKRGILESRVLRFSYVNSCGQRSQRDVEPLRIVFKAHSWYLQAFCRERQACRTYKLSRMRDVILCDELFVRTKVQPLTFDPPSSDAPPTVRVALHFSVEIAHRVYDEFDERCIFLRQDGALEVRIDAMLDEWLISHILSFGQHVTVISPEQLRTELGRRAALIATKYVDFSKT